MVQTIDQWRALTIGSEQINHYDPRVLALSGTHFDTIRGTGNPWMPVINSPFNYESARRLSKEIDAFCKQSQDLGSAPSQNGKLWREAPWRIPCSDREYMDFGSLRATQAILEGYINLTSPDKFYADDISQNCKNYMRALEDQHNRRPFISAQGYVGLAPAHLQPGDAMLKGGEEAYFIPKCGATLCAT
jgi:hypothetical protein